MGKERLNVKKYSFWTKLACVHLGILPSMITEFWRGRQENYEDILRVYELSNKNKLTSSEAVWLKETVDYCKSAKLAAKEQRERLLKLL